MISSPASAAIAFLTGTPGRLLAGLIVVGGLVLGAEIWLARRDAASYARGHRDAVAEWTDDTNRRQALGLAVTARYRATEQGLAASVAAVADHYQGVNRNAQRENDRLRADLRNGRVRLYAETVGGAGCRGSAEAAGGAGGDHGAARAELSPAFAQALVDLAADADAVVEQLSGCQAILEAERAAWDEAIGR